MSAKKRISKVLALLIPSGVIGISAALAATSAHAESSAIPTTSKISVAERLSEIRTAISSVNSNIVKGPSGANLMLAEWLNVGRGFGWRNGGWGNGGWHNGGWGNGGWHNWGNGGWHNWGNGWHNWHNFWHNW
ncbi:GrrA/OscA1 family cyclophane-containing rSAM-modified RiPP [Acidobacterium sp. S8]|uniref:GrrA/OscA1 family cyclophane-containing rSAM-modified RiPP n=1 Tax=Acidobacterium sp. S8 TaxID=1641854 RepID=UPI00131B412D|nr:GrrA/OscA1 family cyclophane-containing rSAM-modified RiPP [Acidobacterium sp. S8]